MPQSSPVFTSVSYDGQWLRSQWMATPPTGFTGYQVTLTENAGAGEVFPVSTTSFTLQRVLTSSSTYTLQITMLVTGQPPITSSLVTLITQAPGLISIVNSGIQVVYRWSAAGGAGVEGYLASLSSPSSDWNNPTDASILTTTFPQVLANAGTCTGWVRGISSDGVVLGPTTPIRTLVTQAPGLTSIANNGIQVDYRWSAAGGAGVEVYIASLSSPVSNWNNLTDVSTLTTEFTQALAGVGTCTGWVRGASSDGIVLGPPSLIRTLVTEAPLITLIDNNGASVVYTWLAAGGSGLEAYFVGLNTPSTNWNNSTDATTLTTTFTQALAGTGICTGWVRGASSDGVVLGPPTPVLELITQPPVLNSLDYDIGALGVVWNPTGEVSVTNYVASVAQAGQPATNYSLGLSGTCTATVILTLGGSYDVSVSGTAPQLKGPPGNILQPLTTSPVAFSLTAPMSGNFKVTWGKDENPRVTGYLVEFIADGTLESSVPCSESPALISETLTSGVIYQSRVRSTAPNLKGPPSNCVNGPYQSRQIIQFDALGRLMGVNWDNNIAASYQIDDFGNITNKTQILHPN